MILNGYEEKLIVKYSEIDQNLAMKPFALLNFLQDTASKNAEDLGFGYSFIYPKGYAWFLIKYRMEFIDYPFNVQEMILKTEPRGCNKLFAYRDFELYSNNRLLARMHSMWSLVDIKSRFLVPIKSVIDDNKYMIEFKKRDDDLNFAKINSIFNSEIIEKEFEVRYNDLDVNGHANNGNYIVWALEPLSYEFKNANKIKTMDMIYKKETKFGEKLIAQVIVNNETETIHKLINLAQEDLFLLKCTWEKFS